MCVPGLDPLTLIGTAATLGGSLINYNIQNDAIEAQNQQNQIAMEEERQARIAEEARQSEMEALQLEAVSRALFDASPEALVSDTAEEEAVIPVEEFQSIADTYNVPALQGQTGEGIVAGQIGQIVADAVNRTRGMLGAQGKLTAQNNAFSGAQDALTRSASEIQNIGSDRSGSIAVAQKETSIPAATVTPSSSPLGDLLLIGGKLGAGIGGRRSGAGNVGDLFRTDPVLHGGLY